MSMLLPSKFTGAGARKSNTTNNKKQSRRTNFIFHHPFSFYYSSQLPLLLLSIISSLLILTTTSFASATTTTTANSMTGESSSIVPSNLFINFIASPQITSGTGQSSSNSTLQFNVIPISIGDRDEINCLTCTLRPPIVYLMINDYGVSFQYQMVSNNPCPSDFIKNFNQNNYTDSDAFLADRLSYSPQYTIGDWVNVTQSTTDQTYTIYGVLYRNNEKMNSGVNCMKIKYASGDDTASSSGIETIAINLASNGGCPPIGGTSVTPSCKLTKDTLYIREQFVYITKKKK